MPDALSVTLPADLADDLRAAAEACEMPVEQYVRRILEREADEAAHALGWNRNIEEDLAALADYDRDGEAIPSEDVFAYLRALHTDDPLPPPKARKLR